jgi:hypothetical protein
MSFGGASDSRDANLQFASRSSPYLYAVMGQTIGNDEPLKTIFVTNSLY